MKKYFLFFIIISALTSCENKTATVLSFGLSDSLDYCYIYPNAMHVELQMKNGDIKKAVYPQKDLQSIRLTIGEKVKTKGITKDGFLIIDK